MRITDAELGELDRLVRSALASGEEGALPVLGFGEISLVLAWPPQSPLFACKRLPVFPSRGRFDAYRCTLEDYLAEIGARGVRVVETELRPVEQSGGGVAGYVVQPILPPENVGPQVLAGAEVDAGHPLVAAIVDTAAATVGPRLGLDAQLANWVWDERGLTYIDVSTPMIWSADDRCRLDMALLAQAFPWVMRGTLRRFLAPRILETYRDLRGVYFDLCGNLIKERLEPWLPAFLERANEHLGQPLSAAEVHRYYRSDRRLWEALLRIRRLDRAWQHRIRRRPYPFLLPKRRRR